ncbi:MAG: NAD(P)/FAD-dependent oxidoreductase, partial [Betaproteobacteria bacterium]
MSRWDVAVIGAGAAGMMAAASAGQAGARVLLIEHAVRLAEKIRISGGGRCNFTNLEAHRPERYVGEQPRFARAALSAYPPRDFLALLARHRVTWHEKHRGQLFCDEGSERIIEVLRAECEDARVAWRMPCAVRGVASAAGGYQIDTEQGPIAARRVIVAAGGLSIPKIGASDLGHRIARHFGLRIVEPRPALVPLTFDAGAWAPFAALAGIALEAAVRRGAARPLEDALSTHRGLSGPAILQISSYWNPGETITVDLAPAWPGASLAEALLDRKRTSRQQIATVLADWLPRRLAEGWLVVQGLAAQARVAELSDKQLRALAASLKRWELVPSGTEGYRKAEVTRGGVATAELDAKTLEARRAPGLHFVGEVVDI